MTHVDFPRFVSWQVNGLGCLKCRANQDMGPVPYGTTFPSGDTEPPAHHGCECSLESEDPEYDARHDEARYNDTSDNSTEDGENQPAT
jgi:hypothetical protein